MLLTVTGLTVTTASGRDVLHDVSFTVEPGERVGIIGESGSGKTLTALSLLGLLAENLHATGTAEFTRTNSADQADGTDSRVDVLALTEKELATIRGGEISMIFQEPLTALDPLQKVGRQITEVMDLHGAVASTREAKTKALALLKDCDIAQPERVFNAYPHELSGGQRQRVLIARALANEPQLIICDEPTTALDVTVQKHILDLIDRLATEHSIALLFISHDMAVVNRMCERVVVLDHGSVVDQGTTAEVLAKRQAARRSGPTPDTAVGSGAADAATPAVELTGVTKTFTKHHLFAHDTQVTGLDRVDLTVPAGMRVGIVGESGSGKSTLLRLIAGLDTPTSGEVDVNGRVQLVFQDPRSSLNPRMRIRNIVGEPLHVHGDLSPAEIDTRVSEALTAVGLAPENTPGILTAYPHQFSGGQRQRISIARALTVRPDILLADEAVSALDPSVRAQVIGVIDRVVADYDMTLVFVSHDLSVVRELCTHVAVIHDGQIVERGTVDEVYAHPQDAYTRELLAAALA